MASLKIFFCLALASIASISTKASQEATNSKDVGQPIKVDMDAVQSFIRDSQATDWKENHYKIYSLKGDPIKPEETLKLLEALRDLYAGRVDKGSIERAIRVGKLLEASRISEEKCDRETLWRLTNLCEYNSIYKINLVPYLKHFVGQQFQTCSRSLNAKLSQSLAKLPKETVEDAAAFRAMVFANYEASDDITKVAPDVLSQAILAFIEHLQGPFDKRLMGASIKLARFHLKPKFKVVVVDLCNEVVEQLDDVAKHYEEMLREKEFQVQLDQDASKWLQTVGMCRYLTQEAETVRLSATEMLYEQCHAATKRNSDPPGPTGGLDPVLDYRSIRETENEYHPEDAFKKFSKWGFGL